MSDDAPEAVPRDMLRGAMVTRTVAVVAHLLVLDSVAPSATIRTVRSGSDLLMLTILGGRDRAETQWRVLLEDAGFEPILIEDGLVRARSP